MKANADMGREATQLCSPILEDVIQPAQYTILVVDDQEETRLSTRLLLESEGYHVRTATTGTEALAQFDPEQIDLVIMDYLMPRMNGPQLIQEMRKRDANVQILLQTGYSGEETSHDILQALRIQGYHNKIDGPDRLLLWIKTICKGAELTRRLAHERYNMMRLYTALHEMRTRLHFTLAHSHFLLDDANSLPLNLIRKSVAALVHHHSTLESLTACPPSSLLDQTPLADRNSRPVRLTDYKHDIRCLAQSLLRETSVQFVCEINAHPPLILTDPNKLLVIIHNVLEYVANSTSHGELRLSTANATADNTLIVTIHATAIASIAEAEAVLANSQQFATLLLPWTHRETVTGLALASFLALRLGGTLTVALAAETGATFAVTLPVDANTADTGSAVPS